LLKIGQKSVIFLPFFGKNRKNRHFGHFGHFWQNDPLLIKNVPFLAQNLTPRKDIPVEVSERLKSASEAKIRNFWQNWDKSAIFRNFVKNSILGLFWDIFVVFRTNSF
jgi:hypothetical protein